MATKEAYERIKNLSNNEIVAVAEQCCGDADNDDYCENKCPYLDVRDGELNPVRFCRQWVMHDLLRIINTNK